MKPTFLLATAMLAGSLAAAPGQTWLRFANEACCGSVYNPYIPNHVVAGDTFKVSLYVAPDGETDPDRFTRLATTNFYAPGVFDGGQVAVSGPATPRYVLCQVRAWESAFGSTWEQAVHAGPRNGLWALRGASRVFSVYVTPAPGLPEQLTAYGMRGFSVHYATRAASINEFDSYAWGGNFGWLDWYPNFEDGVAIGEYVCSGSIYAANVGWINLGDGNPANGIRYQNTTGADHGVNHDGAGNLRGLAWGANIGWMNFESTGAPKFDLVTGKFSGHVWSANAGWISLSNASAHVQTDRLSPAADTDGDGIPDAWEREHADNLTRFNATSDSDGDGVIDLHEYRVGTLPLNPSSNLVLGTEAVSGVGPSPMIVDWVGMPGRVYRIELRDNLNPGTEWVDSGLLGDPSRVSGVGPSPLRAVFGVGPSPLHELWAGSMRLDQVPGVGPSPMRLFRVVAQVPLSAP